jgi:lipoprotein-anchoring transpeptidase ErfK/SrfK
VAVVAVAGYLAVHLHQRHEQQVRAEKAAQAERDQVAAAARAHAIAVAEERSSMEAGLSLSPSAGTTDVPPDAVVTVKTTTGLLRSVVVTDSSGSALAGRTMTGGKSWESSGYLAVGTTYQVKAEAATTDGVTVSKTSTFKVLVPSYEVSASVFPTQDMTVGVGQPIVVRFDQPIYGAGSQQQVLSHFTVSESVPVAGGWHWFSPYELHFRPASYWPAGESITITGNLDGWNAGSGQWGAGVITDSFHIGDSRISYANLASDHMTVTLDGKVVADYPISGGSTVYPTMDGDHIVMDKESVVHMVSSTVGIPVNSPAGYDEYVYNDVHISDSGEYVHAAPWSVYAQGVTNVSHGCINLAPSNSLSFYNFSQIGDVVEVTGSPRPAVAGDHGVMDWSTPWPQWVAAHVYRLGTAPASTTTAASPATAAAPTTTVAPASYGGTATTSAALPARRQGAHLF